MSTVTDPQFDERPSLLAAAPMAWLAILLTALAVLAAVAPSAEAAEQAVGIESVNFGPGFEHDLPDGAEHQVRKVFYGDFTADGVPDAIALITWQFNDREREAAMAYTVDRSGDVVRLGQVGWSDEWSRLNAIEIVDQRVRVESLHGQAGERANSMTTKSFTHVDGYMQAHDSWPSQTYRYFDTKSDTASAVAEPLTIDVQSQSLVVDLAAEVTQRSFIFNADGGDTVLLQSSAANGEFRIYERSGRLVGVARNDHLLTLPAGSSWIGVVAGSDRSAADRFTIRMAEQRALYAPRFATTVEHETLSEAPSRSMTITYPQLTWAHANVDVDDINSTLREFAETLRNEHLQRARACTDDTDTRLTVDGTVELLSYDLMSVRFDVFECLCGSADDWRSYGLTLDLSTGRVLELDDLLGDADTARDHWFDDVASGHYLFGEDQALAHVTRSTLDDVDVQVVLSPKTMSLIVQGTDLDDKARSAVTVFVPEEDRTSLLNGHIAQRALDGADVVLPVIECGC